MKQVLTIFLVFSVAFLPAAAQSRRLKAQQLIPITINEFTAAAGLSKINVPYSHSMVGFTTIQGVEIDGNMVIALGTGLSSYNGGSLVPLFMDFRKRFYQYGKYTYCFFGDGGFLFKVSQRVEYSKIFINPGFGVDYEISPYFSADAGLGLLVQQGARRDSFINFKLGITYVLRK